MQLRQSSDALPKAMVLTATRHRDERGWFSETWNVERMRAMGLNVGFVQDNHSFSPAKGTLRGLHYQRPPRAQDKLVRCSSGAILDVAVDVRLGSPTYGQWLAEELSAANGRQLFVPKGFLHGFVTFVADTEVQYKCSDTYAPDCDGSVRWDSLGIDWGVSDPILSAKDAAAVVFAEFISPFVYGGSQ
jgi:dTDP-4-dehydrorhamnose 3,5-epimerase